MPSRRKLLGGVAGGGVTLVGAGWVGRLGPVETRPPDADAWPLERRDATNAASTDAPAPGNPGVAWKRAATGDDGQSSLVVGRETVYVGGGRVVALDRTDGSSRWDVAASGNALALADGNLYAAPGRTAPDSESPTLRAYDTADGTELWTRSLPSPVYGLLSTADGLFVGCHGSLLGVGHGGDERWRLDAPGAGAVYPMVHDGSLYAGHPGYVRRYGRRRLLDVPLGAGPDPAWEGEDVSGSRPSTVVAGRLVMGSEQARVDRGDPAVHAFDLADGERAWNAVPGPDGSEVSVAALTPARVDDVGATGVVRLTDRERTYAVVGLDLRDGTRLWRRSLDGVPRAVAATRDGFLVAGGGTLSAVDGYVRAYAPDGSERWTVPLPAGASAVAPVDGAVFAALDDGRAVRLD